MNAPLSKIPTRPGGVDIALNMMRETKGGAEVKLWTPMCWDFARYVAQLEAVVHEIIAALQSELDHCASNDLRMAPEFGRVEGKPGVPASYLEAVIQRFSDGTTFSNFISNASPAEKAGVYGAVMDKVAEHQAATIAVAAERARCAAVADDEARIREEAGQKHAEGSEARSRCFAGARAAANVAKGIRNGEVVAGVPAADRVLPHPIGKIFSDGYWNLNVMLRNAAEVDPHRRFHGGVDVYTVDQVREILGTIPTVPVNRPATAAEAQHASRIGACLPNGVLFDAFGRERVRYVRVIHDGTSCVVPPGDVADMVDTERPEDYRTEDVYLSKEEFDRLPEFDGF